MENGPVVVVAHDYQCPWCYLSLFQAKRLQKEFPTLKFDWQGYELLPDATTQSGERPHPSDRMKDLAAADGIPLSTAWPRITNSHNALEGAEYFKENHPELFDQYNETVYRTFWEEGRDISDSSVLSEIVAKLGVNSEDFIKGATAKKYSSKIFPFKESAYERGITRVTTFRFSGEQCAEAPYSTIKDMARRYVEINAKHFSRDMVE
jgi:predicted DsbA family dithiol-disulfide isomerase